MLSWIDAPSALKEKKYYEKRNCYHIGNFADNRGRIYYSIMINKDVGGANNPSSM